MMPTQDHQTDDLLVTKETILKLFEHPPSNSTFYEWVNSGKIIKARHLKGYFLLNATRVKLRMPPTDIAAYRQQRASPKVRKCEVHLAALSVLVPETLELFTDIEMPEALTLEEYSDIQSVLKRIQPELDAIPDTLDKLRYCRGFLDIQDQ